MMLITALSLFATALAPDAATIEAVIRKSLMTPPVGIVRESVQHRVMNGDVKDERYCEPYDPSKAGGMSMAGGKTKLEMDSPMAPFRGELYQFSLESTPALTLIATPKTPIAGRITARYQIDPVTLLPVSMSAQPTTIESPLKTMSLQGKLTQLKGFPIFADMQVKFSGRAMLVYSFEGEVSSKFRYGVAADFPNCPPKPVKKK
jgi:hypothetical protein